MVEKAVRIILIYGHIDHPLLPKKKKIVLFFGIIFFFGSFLIIKIKKNPAIIILFFLKHLNYVSGMAINSLVAQRQRVGPITQRSMDRNHPELTMFFDLKKIKKNCLGS